MVGINNSTIRLLFKTLSVFFTDIENFSPLTWLVFPLFLYILITFKKRKRWERAVFFLFILSYLIVSIGGRGYSRYFLTFYPITIAAAFYYGWELIREKNKILKISAFLLILITMSINYIHFNEYYRFYWRYKVAAIDDYFPKILLDYFNKIQDLDSEDRILIYSRRHLFFYHVDKKGIDFRDPNMNLFYIQEETKTALEILRNKIKIKYILLQKNITAEWPLTGPFQEIITKNCDLVIQENGLELYRLREKELDKEYWETYFVNESLLKNGSLEIWSRGPDEKPDYFEGGDNVIKGMVKREESEVKVGQYSAKIQGDNFNFTQEIPNFKDYSNKDLTCFVWIKTNTSNKYRIQIYDGIHSSFSVRHSGTGNWELLQVNHTVNPSATKITIRIIQAEKSEKMDDIVYVDGALLVEGDWNTFYLYREHIKSSMKLFSKPSLLKNGSFENWSSGPSNKPDFFEGGDNIAKGMVAREEIDVKIGKYSVKFKGDNYNFSQDLSNIEDLKGKYLTCFAWVKTGVPSKYRIQIYDGFHSNFSERHSGNGVWELLLVNHTVNPSATKITIRIIQAEKSEKMDDIVYVDGALLVEGNWTTYNSYALHMIKDLYY